ncbi:MAG: pyridoxal phosphate-dependent aminotransferase [archaeon]
MKDFPISKRAGNVKKSVILEIDVLARSLEAQGKPVTKLHIGNMWQRTDELIISKAHEAMLAGRTGYEGVASCIPELGEALVDYWKRKYGVTIEKEWIVTGPSIGLLNQTLDCLLEPGKRVGIPIPAWEVYYSQVSETLAAQETVPMDFSEGRWRMPSFSGKAMDLFLINDPHNPTSSVLDEKSREKILTGLSETHAPIMVDMAYDNLYWDCDFKPLLQYHEIADRVITVGSFSKSLRMAGWRIGYLISSNEDFLDVFRHKVRKDWTCAPPFTQYAAAYGLSREFEHRQREWCETVKRISKKTVETLRSSGIVCTEPEGTIYVFANVGADSAEFSNHLIKNHGIAVVPGKCFGENASEWIRMTPVAVPEEKLDPAIETISEAAQVFHT